jgi:hypothetical protein
LGGFVHNVATIGTPGTGWDWLGLNEVRGNPHGPRLYGHEVVNL